MPYTPLTASDILAAILRDRKNLRPEDDISVDSDNYVRAAGTASAIEGLYQRLLWVTKQIFPDSADPDMLLLHARKYNMNLKPASLASGKAAFTGIVGKVVPSGLSLKFNDGTAYVTTGSGEIGMGGAVEIPCQAVVAGVAGNRFSGDVLTVTVPPSGVNAATTVVSMNGGADVESYASLLARLLVRIRHPPAGGNKYDYWQWAMEVSGVSAAYVYPMRREVGTVDVVVVSPGGLPSEAVLAAVQAHVDDQRPVTAKNFAAIAPIVRPYDVIAQVDLSGITLDAAKSALTTAIQAYDAALVPGDAAVRTRIGAVISDTAGIADYVLLQPTGNVVPTVDATAVEWCRLRNVDISLMP
ncbi:baseplate J family protein [Pandoraea captiosa]|uniref:Baseplate J family protein n=1 Tax=Pandoraea captiosa TaxID=2508302 RepID=A0A5E4ZEM5_9BURK|nr:baseplate J/gp47 family protein [Pandoraea captiosa]VVE59749.1 baseplate J family protein [Pandoraea captiosa]